MFIYASAFGDRDKHWDISLQGGWKAHYVMAPCFAQRGNGVEHRACFVNDANEEMAIKSLLISTLIALTLAITVASPANATTPPGETMSANPAVVPSEIEKQPDLPTFDNTSTKLRALLGVDNGESHWPISFKTVYPTGEKPLFVITLKCPTEAAFGVAPPPVKLVHIVLTTLMEGINSTGLLPVNLQQVCQ